MENKELIELQNGDRVQLESCWWHVYVEKDNQKFLIRNDGFTYDFDNWDKYGNVQEDSGLDNHWNNIITVQRINSGGVYKTVWDKNRKKYDVSFVVDTRFNVLVEADSPEEAYRIANRRWNCFIVNDKNQEGELETVDFKLEHIEDEDGKYYYREDLKEDAKESI